MLLVEPVWPAESPLSCPSPVSPGLLPGGVPADESAPGGLLDGGLPDGELGGLPDGELGGLLDGELGGELDGLLGALGGDGRPGTEGSPAGLGGAGREGGVRGA